MKTDYRNYRIFQVLEKGALLLGRSGRVFRYDPSSEHISLLFDLYSEKWLSRILSSGISGRLLRRNMGHVLELNRDTHLCFLRYRILRYNQGELKTVYRSEFSRFPLQVAWNHRRDEIIWGEYYRQRLQRGLKIYRSRDKGRTWQCVYTFPIGAIRHVHSIAFDKFRDGYWICTGDEDHESGIWFTHDFQHVEVYLLGAQRYRAVSVIPDQEGLILPTDTASERNVIQYFRHSDRKLVYEIPVGGSCMYAERIGSGWFVSTTYEPSDINRLAAAELWYCPGDHNWRKITTIPKDIWPVQYFQYPVIEIPRHPDNHAVEEAYFSFRGLRGVRRSANLSELRS